MSWQNAALSWALRRWVKPRSRSGPDVAASRALTRRVPFGAKLPAGWRIRIVNTAPLIGEWTEPAAAGQGAPPRCILYLHGGGYICMAPRSYRSVTSRLAVCSDASLFALDYRLAPEFPFPAALDDAMAAYRGLIAAGTPPGCIVLAGDSAGGGLALALLVALRDAGERLPAAAVLFSPWTDLAATGQSLVTNSESDALLFGDWVAPAARYYLATTPATHPLASPVYADLTGLPPMLLQVSDTEVLLDDSRRVAAHAARSGVAVTLRIWPGLPHVWQMFAPFLPEGRTALHEAACYVQSHLAAESGDGGVPVHAFETEP